MSNQFWWENAANLDFDAWARRNAPESTDEYCGRVDDEIRAAGELRVPLLWTLTAGFVFLAALALIAVILL